MSKSRYSDLSRGFLLLVFLAVLNGSLSAQTDQETKRSIAKRLLNEGLQLRDEGSKESLTAAISKFEEARPLFHSLNVQLNEAFVVLAIGRCYGDLDEYEKYL